MTLYFLTGPCQKLKETLERSIAWLKLSIDTFLTCFTRYDWYQTETHVIITIMIKNTKQENVKVEFGEKTVS